MNTKYSDYSNKEYFGFLKESLCIVIRRADGEKTIQKLRNKLKKTNLEIFDKVILYYRMIMLSTDLYQHTLSSTDNDFEKITSVRITKQETNAVFEEYLISIDKLVFLGAISEIGYWLAKVEGKRMIKMYKDFLSSWLQWHKYLTSKKKNQREGEKIIEKLRLVLGSKIDDYQKISNDHMQEVDRFKNGRGNIFVNVDFEINTAECIVPSFLRLPERWYGEKQDFRIIEENTMCVELGNDSYSLKEYYHKIKTSIDKNWLKSNDLLKQIITVYLIKKCQNGDDEAFNILFSIYKKQAEFVTSSFIKKHRDLAQAYSIEGRGLTILACLLKGDDPGLIFSRLGYGRADKKDGVDVLNKKPYRALQESYDLMFSIVCGQLVSLEKELRDLDKNTNNQRSRLKNKLKTSTRESYSRNIFVHSTIYLSKINSSVTLFTLFEPLSFLRISNSYNKDFFVPKKDENLTVWLFGNKKGAYRGKVLVYLHDLFRGTKVQRDQTYDDNLYYPEEN